MMWLTSFIPEWQAICAAICRLNLKSADVMYTTKLGGL